MYDNKIDLSENEIAKRIFSGQQIDYKKNSTKCKTSPMHMNPDTIFLKQLWLSFATEDDIIELKVEVSD